jgi:hypothetical protein
MKPIAAKSKLNKAAFFIFITSLIFVLDDTFCGAGAASF